MSDHFVLLWSDILRSSINEHKVHVKWGWVTILLMCDKEGNFRCTAANLARVANMPVGQAEDALVELSKPDPYSTSQKDEGRRIVSVGQNLWHIVNYKEYRQRASYQRDLEQGRIRQQRFRDKGRNGDVTVPNDEALSDRDTVLQGVTPVVVGVGVGVDVCDVKKKGIVKGKKQRGWIKPVAFEVDVYLEERGETRFSGSEFIDANEAKGWLVGNTKTPMKDWKASVRTWITNRNRKGEAQRGPPPKQVVEDAEALEETMKHILKHSNALLILRGLTDAESMIIRPAAKELAKLADSDMPKGLMEQKFYDVHDAMMEDILHSLDEDDLMQLEAHCPAQVQFETFARKTLQKRFSIPDPMEYEFSPQDVPA
jgi:hypothetical protein